ncbi:class I SAM-dependent methyltransferase [Actinophytocola sediminis]
MSRVWDYLSCTSALVERLPTIGAMHRAMLGATGIGPGDTVLDLGCGTGGYFAPVLAAIGDTGQLVGVDLSQASVRRARARIARLGWSNVAVEHADAATADLGDARYDAAFAMYSLSAIPDYRAAIRRAHTALRPGGRLFVADVRLVPGGRAAPAIWLFRALYRGLAGASGEDITPAIRDTFDHVDLWDPHDNRPVAMAQRPWPPLVMLVATR